MRVTRKHDGALHARFMQTFDRRLRRGLERIGDDDVSGILACDRHLHDCARVVTRAVLNSETLHELAIASGHFDTVDLRRHAETADFLDVCDTRAVELLAVSLLQTAADGMRRGALSERGKFQEFFVIHRAVMHAIDFEDAARQGARLVEDDGVDLGEHFEVVRALDEHALAARTADAREEAQGNADDECAWAAHDEEDQGAVNPCTPVGRGIERGEAHDGRHDGEEDGGRDDDRRIDARKTCDERLRARLARAGILDKFQNLRGGRFVELLRRTNLQDAREIDAAADDGVPLLHVARQALARQCARIERRCAIRDDAVDGDLFARLHDDLRADFDFVGVTAYKFSIFFHVCVIGADVHELADIPAAPADGIALKPFADLVEEHDGDAFHIVAILVESKPHRADGRDRHQEILVERTTIPYALRCLDDDVIADDEVRHDVEEEARQTRHGQLAQDDHQGGRQKDADEISFLFLVHENTCFPTT